MSLQFDLNKKEDRNTRCTIMNVSEDSGAEVKDREEQDGGYFEAVMERNSEESDESIDSFVRRTEKENEESTDPDMKFPGKKEALVDDGHIYPSGDEESSSSTDAENGKDLNVTSHGAGEISFKDRNVGPTIHDMSKSSKNNVMTSGRGDEKAGDEGDEMAGEEGDEMAGEEGDEMAGEEGDEMAGEGDEMAGEEGDEMVGEDGDDTADEDDLLAREGKEGDVMVENIMEDEEKDEEDHDLADEEEGDVMAGEDDDGVMTGEEKEDDIMTREERDDVMNGKEKEDDVMTGEDQGDGVMIGEEKEDDVMIGEQKEPNKIADDITAGEEKDAAGEGKKDVLVRQEDEDDGMTGEEKEDMMTGEDDEDLMEGEEDEYDLMTGEEKEDDILADEDDDDDLLAGEDDTDEVLSHERADDFMAGEEKDDDIMEDEEESDVMASEDDDITADEEGNDLMTGEDDDGDDDDDIMTGEGDYDLMVGEEEEEDELVGDGDILADEDIDLGSESSGESEDTGSLLEAFPHSKCPVRKESESEECRKVEKNKNGQLKVDEHDLVSDEVQSEGKDEITRSGDNQIKGEGESVKKQINVQSIVEKSDIKHKEVEGEMATKCEIMDNKTAASQETLSSEDQRYSESSNETTDGGEDRESLDEDEAPKIDILELKEITDTTPNVMKCENESNQRYTQDDLLKNKENNELYEEVKTVEHPDGAGESKLKVSEVKTDSRGLRDEESLGQKKEESGNIVQTNGSQLLNTQINEKEDEKTKVIGGNECKKESDSDLIADLDKGLRRSTRTQICINKESGTNENVQKKSNGSKAIHTTQQVGGGNGALLKKSVSNIERIKRKLEEILEVSKVEEDAAIEELHKMKREKTEILNKISSEMEKLKGLLTKQEHLDQKK